jgi:hypothetical protein
MRYFRQKKNWEQKMETSHVHGCDRKIWCSIKLFKNKMFAQHKVEQKAPKKNLGLGLPQNNTKWRTHTKMAAASQKTVRGAAALH